MHALAGATLGGGLGLENLHQHVGSAAGTAAAGAAATAVKPNSHAAAQRRGRKRSTADDQPAAERDAAATGGAAPPAAAAGGAVGARPHAGRPPLAPASAPPGAAGWNLNMSAPPGGVSPFVSGALSNITSSSPAPLGLTLDKSRTFQNMVISALRPAGKDKGKAPGRALGRPAGAADAGGAAQGVPAPRKMRGRLGPGPSSSSGAAASSGGAPSAGAPPGGGEKIKAANFPAQTITLGSWSRGARYEGDVVAKCYYAKRKLVWEILEHGLKSKLETVWDDVESLVVHAPKGECATLELQVSRAPQSYQERAPVPRKHTNWQACADFTGGQAAAMVPHVLTFAPGLLDKPLEVMLKCDERLAEIVRFVDEPPEAAKAAKATVSRLVQKPTPPTDQALYCPRGTFFSDGDSDSLRTHSRGESGADASMSPSLHTDSIASSDAMHIANSLRLRSSGSQSRLRNGRRRQQRQRGGGRGAAGSTGSAQAHTEAEDFDWAGLLVSEGGTSRGSDGRAGREQQRQAGTSASHARRRNSGGGGRHSSDKKRAKLKGSGLIPLP